MRIYLNELKNTPLHNGEHGHTECVKLLLEAKTKPELTLWSLRELPSACKQAR
jgi:hypothetical protein